MATRKRTSRRTGIVGRAVTAGRRALREAERRVPPDVRRQVERRLKDADKTARAAIKALQAQAKKASTRADVNSVLKRIDDLTKQARQAARGTTSRASATRRRATTTAKRTAKRATTSTRRAASTARRKTTKTTTTRRSTARRSPSSSATTTTSRRSTTPRRRSSTPRRRAKAAAETPSMTPMAGEEMGAVEMGEVTQG